jgi:hypothetical protein
MISKTTRMITTEVGPCRVQFYTGTNDDRVCAQVWAVSTTTLSQPRKVTSGPRAAQPTAVPALDYSPGPHCQSISVGAIALAVPHVFSYIVIAFACVCGSDYKPSALKARAAQPLSSPDSFAAWRVAWMSGTLLMAVRTEAEPF